MQRIRRFVASILAVLLLQTGLTSALLAKPAYALDSGYQDPLDTLPDWALDGYNPADPMAGLLPRNPLDGLLPQVPTPQLPGQPGGGGAQQATHSLKAPADVKLPSPPQAPDCRCAPGTVNVGTGALSLTDTDLSLIGLGPAMDVTRRYSSAKADKDGPFG